MEDFVTLLVIRHAWAEERGDRWPDDSQRPLSSLGCDRWEQVVKHLAKVGVRPTIIATSPYVRCRQTAGIFAETIPKSPAIVEIAALEPGSDLGALIQWTREQAAAGHTQIAWVGHAPDTDDLAADLIGSDACIRFAKGAIAEILFEEEVEAGAGELRALLTAKTLGL